MSYPYSFIEQWWGEDLTPELQRRIEAAPFEHLQSFAHDLSDISDQLMGITPRPDGVIRPLLQPVDSQSTIDYISMALNVLLYAHEIIIDPPMHSSRPEEIPTATAQLLAIKPLVDVGAIHLGWVTPRVLHPSLGYPDVDPAESAVRRDHPTIENQIGANELDRLILRVLQTIKFANKLPGRANALARNELEFKILTTVLRAAWIDRTYFDLTSLARMSLPNLHGKIADLVAIRQSEESFAMWREALARAITQLAQLPDEVLDWRRDAIEIVDSELEPLRQKIVRESSRSNALSMLNKGVSAVLIGGAGIAAGWATGGGATSALASSGASIGIASAADYLRKMKERRQNKAILDLVLAFKSDILE